MHLSHLGAASPIASVRSLQTNRAPALDVLGVDYVIRAPRRLSMSNEHARQVLRDDEPDVWGDDEEKWVVVSVGRLLPGLCGWMRRRSRIPGWRRR